MARVHALLFCSVDAGRCQKGSVGALAQLCDPAPAIGHLGVRCIVDAPGQAWKPSGQQAGSADPRFTGSAATLQGAGWPCGDLRLQ